MIKNFIVKFLASCGFVGHIPIASGTFGTMIGIGLVWILHQFIDITQFEGKIWYAAITILLIIASIPVSTAAEKLYNEKDPSEVVIDEAVSFFVTVFWLPLSPLTVIAGFFLNRIFDIIKIEPARWCQNNLPSGRGVVLDDIVAGVYSHICLRLIIFLTVGSFFS
ncbi:MAG: phosphatidylglycerophosphatase A [Candidatus Auribacter fodinae]|uniref:Phosphatidylglycerophosphatase A n=1 Tax=Candidatus Auribacter fodinae TaxID=2093366 RepID=A0A3A4R1S1_9BACT|nr:MAG: phosphatidylglycerophosphatase A [Candidatus Auribacter fodinae]